MITKELTSNLTTLSFVITTNIYTLFPEISVLKVSQNMHDKKFLTFSVCESDSRVFGVVDVMNLIYGRKGLDKGNNLGTESIHCLGYQSLRSVCSSRLTELGAMLQETRIEIVFLPHILIQYCSQ